MPYPLHHRATLFGKLYIFCATSGTGIDGLHDFLPGHDSSIRLWNIETKTCVQELTVHRKKFEESVNDVAFHPSKPLLASAGADAVAKVYV